MQDLESRTEQAVQDENAAIADTLDRILAQRQTLAAEMDQIADRLKKRAVQTEKLEQMDTFLRSFSDDDRRKLFGTKEGDTAFAGCITLAREYKTKLLAAAQEYQALGVRFRRQSVNLGVIGSQGAGKSCLLQSLSGLSNDFIPSSDGPSCTGVTCVIENVPELTEPEVYFTLKDEKTVEREINQELENLWNDITGSPDGAPRLGSGDTWKQSLQAAFQKMEGQLGQRGIASGKVYNNWKIDKDIYCEQFDKWRPLVFPVKPARSGPDHAELPEEMWDNLFSQWREQMQRWSEGLRGALELDPDWANMEAPRCRLTDLSAVSEFVSKRSAAGAGGREIFQFHSYHIAIREAHIRIAFAGIKAHICLIDTVGIGDNANDTTDRMNRAIDVNSDGLIFLHRYPEPARETPEIDELANICKERAATRPGDWVAFLMNVVPKPDCSSQWIANYFDPQVTPDTLELPPDALNPQKIRMNAAALAHYAKGLSDNAEGLELFSRNSPNQNGRYIRLHHITDVNQPDAVKQFLNQFLKQISEHLGDIDDAKKCGAKDKWKAAEEAEEKLTQALRALCIPTHSSLDIIRSHMSDKQEMLRRNLDRFYDEIHTNLKSPLQTCYDNIQEQFCDDRELRNVVAGIDENFGQLRTLIRASEKLYQNIRLKAMESSSAYEKQEREFKDRLSELFVDTLGIDLSKLGSAEPLRKSDEKYFEKLGRLLFQETPGTAELMNFFQSIQRFHLNDSSVMAEAIVCHVAAKHLSISRIRDLTGIGTEEETEAASPDPVPNADAGPAAAAVNGRRREAAAPAINFVLPQRKHADPPQRKPADPPRKEGPVNAESTGDIVDILHQNLIKLLGDIQASLSIEATYSIPPQERLKEEILNFKLCFSEPYKDIWLCVFSKLYEKGAILQNETESLHKIYNTSNQIRQYVGEYLAGTL